MPAVTADPGVSLHGKVVISGSRGIESVVQYQMYLGYENPIDGAYPRCIPPLIQILEGPTPSLGFSFGPFFRSLRQRSKGYQTGPFPYLISGQTVDT